jgi:signal transduction histidine kinase
MNFIFFALGIISLQFVYILMNFILFRKKEFLYFILALLCITIFFILRIVPELNPFLKISGEDKFSSSYALILLSFSMYYKFIRYYLDLHLFYPRFNRAFLLAEKISLVVGIVVFVLGIFSLQHISEFVFKGAYVLSIPFNLTFIIYLGTRRKKINRIIILGTLFAMLVVRISTFQFLSSNSQVLSMWNYQIIIASTLLLLLFLNYALLYKSRLYQLEQMRMEIHNKMELSLQRTSISADLHDDLGASLSSIHLNATMVQKNLMDSSPQIKSSLSKMIIDLKLVMENMGDIVWAINVNGNEQKSMSSQLKDFYFDLMESQDVQCNYHIDEKLEALITDINARKNLLLIAKEAISNILKHAQASEIDVSLSAQGSQLFFEIQDNGIGMTNLEKINSGNGLRNMRFRAEKLKGTCTIKSALGLGTTISCIIPITNISYRSPLAV